MLEIRSDQRQYVTLCIDFLGRKKLRILVLAASADCLIILRYKVVM